MSDKITDAIEQCISNFSSIQNNFPPDAQRQISRYYDFDSHHIKILEKLEMFSKKAKKFTSADGQQMKQMLLETLDLADRKVEISDRIMHLVEDNMFKLNMSFKSIEMANPKKNSSKNPKRLLKWVPNYKEVDSDSIDDVLTADDSNEHSMMKTKTIQTSKKKVQLREKVDNKFQTSETISTDTTQNVKKKIKNKHSRKQCNKGKKTEELSDSDSDVEPTYCICEEISYGSMVCCDNDLCPIEWFHFKCVSLRRKPKGKWYCPRCRGTSAKVMKPRKVFFQELEEYNKRKEEGL